MPKFSNRSNERLDTCHPSLQKVFREVVSHYDCTILQGHRTQEEQDRFFNEKKSKVQWPNSKHNSNPSMAVDVMPYLQGEPHIDWEDTAAIAKFAGFVLGIATAMGVKLRWGGDWDSDNRVKDERFLDMPHFELVE